MGGRSPGSTWVTLQLSHDEKAHLDALVRASGKTRNRYLRDLLASLTPSAPAG